LWKINICILNSNIWETKKHIKIISSNKQKKIDNTSTFIILSPVTAKWMRTLQAHGLAASNTSMESHSMYLSRTNSEYHFGFLSYWLCLVTSIVTMLLPKTRVIVELSSRGKFVSITCLCKWGTTSERAKILRKQFSLACSAILHKNKNWV
jgi:hypothetical protein